jgi:transcriptional regulator with XRE-family HTH domain
MTESQATDGPIDQLVKARWQAMGLSQTDLAEVLDAAFAPIPLDDNAPNAVAADRLVRVAEALQFSVGFLFPHRSGETKRVQPDPASAETPHSLQSLLALRLMRAFHDLTDQRTKEVLVHLAEQIVRRQADGHGDSA